MKNLGFDQEDGLREAVEAFNAIWRSLTGTDHFNVADDIHLWHSTGNPEHLSDADHETADDTDEPGERIDEDDGVDADDIEGDDLDMSDDDLD